MPPSSTLPIVKMGEIYYVREKHIDAQGHEQKCDRPYVIVSSAEFNAQTAVGVPLTTAIHKARAHRLKIQLAFMVKNPSCTRNLSDSVALTDHIRVLDVTRLERPPMGHLNKVAIGGLQSALSLIFDIL